MSKKLDDMKTEKSVKFATAVSASLFEKFHRACRDNNVRIKFAVEYGMEQFLNLIKEQQNEGTKNTTGNENLGTECKRPRKV